MTQAKRNIVLEVMFKAKYCLICQYMDEAVREILPKYDSYIDYQRVDIEKASGKKRFLELSVSLFGRDGVYKQMRIAPIPSLFINGELFFETIPPKPMLEEAIEEVIAEQFQEKDNG